MISPRVAIDAGVKALGWARGDASRITAAGCSRTRESLTVDEAADLHSRAIGWGSATRVVLETMHWDGRRMTTVNDLLNVQAVGCIVAARVGCVVVTRAPHDWKAQIPKEIHHPRILDALDAGERRVVDEAVARAGTNAKEVLDAVGIWLHDAGRINKSGGPRR